VKGLQIEKNKHTGERGREESPWKKGSQVRESLSLRSQIERMATILYFGGGGGTSGEGRGGGGKGGGVHRSGGADGKGEELFRWRNKGVCDLQGSSERKNQGREEPPLRGENVNGTNHWLDLPNPEKRRDARQGGKHCSFFIGAKRKWKKGSLARRSFMMREKRKY